MKIAVVGGVLLALGLVAVGTGVLPLSDAVAIWDRMWPILLFVIAVTIVAELTAEAGVFDLSAHLLARMARGRTMVLWLLIVLLAVAVTAFLSLDTTAVLLTPIVVAVARSRRLDPLPFAFTTVWIANTGSLVLPVSNLTNLLAMHRLGFTSPAAFVALLGPSALIAIVVTVALLYAVFHRSLRGMFPAAPMPVVIDRVRLVVASIVLVALLPLLVAGIPPWMPTAAAAIALIVLFAVRSPAALRFALVPWQLVLFAGGLFLAVGALAALGSGAVLSTLVGSGGDLIALWRMAGIGMLGANAIDNLPAYLALESTAQTPQRLAALLVGVNAGPLITAWASLATLLWHDRLRGVGVDVPWRRYAILGVAVAPATVALAVVPLAFA